MKTLFTAAAIATVMASSTWAATVETPTSEWAVASLELNATQIYTIEPAEFELTQFTIEQGTINTFDTTASNSFELAPAGTSTGYLTNTEITYTDLGTPSTVPVPASVALMLSALGGLGIARRRR